MNEPTTPADNQNAPMAVASGAVLGCPFCGTKPEIIIIGNNHTAKRKVTIKCPNCRVQRTDAGIITPLTTLMRVAIEQWNKRVAGQPNEKS